MKILKKISVISLVFILTSGLIFAQEVEPELEQFLADNPDILETASTNKQDKSQDKPIGSQVITAQTETSQVNAEEVASDQDSSSNPEIANAELETQLQAITEEFNSIFYNYLFLDQTTSLNQTELSNLKLLVDNRITNIKWLADLDATSGLDCAPWYAQRLSEVIYWFKFACLNLEALSVSSEDSRISSLEEPLDFVEMQRTKFAILVSLFDMYNPSVRKGPVPLAWIDYSEKSVRSIIFKSLPRRLQSSIIQYILCGITQSSAQAYYLSKILNQNFYEENIVLSEEYFEIISAFYKAQKFGESLEADVFLNKIEEVINEFAPNRNPELTSDQNRNSNLVLELLLTKLIKIKNDVVKFYKPSLNFKDDQGKNNQEKAKLLIRYKLFLENKKFELLFTNRQFCAFFDLYCNFLQDFFANKLQPQVADLRLFEVECMLENLIKDKQLSWLMQQLKKKNPELAVLDDMGNLLVSIRAIVNKDLKINEKGFFANIKDAIFSGNWIDTGKFKVMSAGTSQTVVDFLEYAFDRKFENFKEAAFFLLARTSPVLAAGLLCKVMPYLSGDLQEKTSKLLDETGLGGSKLSEAAQNATDSANPKLSDAKSANADKFGNDTSDDGASGDGTSGDGTSGDGNKIFDFISKNPDIFNKLCEVKPELVNGLADVVEHRLIKAKS